jgi:hypothetical protein
MDIPTNSTHCFIRLRSPLYRHSVLAVHRR